MSRIPSSVFFLVFLAFLLTDISAADAATVAESEELTLELRGMGEAGATVATSNHAVQSGPQIGLARLSGRATYHDLGRVFVQFEARTGDVLLHDVLAVLYLSDWLNLRLGYFKTPVSADYNVSTARKPFPGRALITDLTPKRGTGGEAYFHRDFHGVTTELSLGVFAPLFLRNPSADALIMTARARLGLPMGLTFHAGYHDDFGQATWADDEPPFYLDQNRLIDLAVTFDNDDWFAHAEAVFAPHRAPAYTPAGLYLAAGHRIGTISEGPTFEPVVGYDLMMPTTDAPSHRVRGGLNFYLLDYRIVPNVHYEMTIDADATIGHAGVALLRMGF